MAEFCNAIVEKEEVGVNLDYWNTLFPSPNRPTYEYHFDKDEQVLSRLRDKEEEGMIEFYNHLFLKQKEQF